MGTGPEFRPSLAVVALGLVLGLSGCSPDGSSGGREASSLPPGPGLEEGNADLRPVLRVITRPDPVDFLPRNAEPVDLDRRIAARLAEALDRRLELLVEPDYSRMIDRLVAGEGDLILANMTVTGPRAARVSFTVPYTHVDELLVVRETDSAVEEVGDLDGWTLHVRASSSYAETLHQLAATGVGIEIADVSDSLATEDIVDAVARGSYRGTVVDSHLWAALSRHHEELVAPLVLARDRPIAIAVHRDDDALRQRLNEVLFQLSLVRRRTGDSTGDMPAIQERGRLRMITRNNAVNYFLHKGAQYGFEFELMREFARQHGLDLEIVIPPSHETLIPWLLEGRGDVIAASMTITPERSASVAFTRAYQTVDELVVVRADLTGIEGPAQLPGRIVHVRQSSAFAASLLELQRDVQELRIEFLPEVMETEEALALVEEGRIAATVSDSNLLAIELAYGRDLRSAFVLREGERLGWAVRKGNPELLAALNDYLAREYRGLRYNVIHRRYFDDPRQLEHRRDGWRSDVSGRISPYDDLVRRHAGENELDWRLVSAQMYQESRFDPDRRSWAGAVGLMQMLPRTAGEMGVENPADPEGSIQAGTRYLRRQIDLLDPKIPLGERVRLALASYNAGRGHVSDARRLARETGLSPDRWFGNVEQAMLLLQKPEYYRRARFGYCRGSEPVRYVRAIDHLYGVYVRHVPDVPSGR